jgi:hypothetical protein
MNDDNTETQLETILKTTARTEERARHIEENMERFQERTLQHRRDRTERINELEDKTRRNSLILTASLFVVGVFMTAFSSWMFGLV